MNILYTPQDISAFLLAADFSQSYERAVVRNIWRCRKDFIEEKYRDNLTMFRRHIQYEMAKQDGVLDDLDELSILLGDTEHAIGVADSSYQQSIVEGYFKAIKLSIVYDIHKKNDYRKIKLRRLLRMLGYRRRSSQLIEFLVSLLSALELETYSRGGARCDIATIGLDDMVMIRIKS